MSENKLVKKNDTSPLAASRKLNVLLVDDNPYIREVYAEVLRGHFVTAVDSGREALHMVTTVLFDVILMDIQMPGMSGIEAARQIRALKGECGSTPIIAFSARNSPKDIDEAYKAGIDDFVSKQAIQDLFAALERVSNQSRKRTTTASEL